MGVTLGDFAGAFLLAERLGVDTDAWTFRIRTPCDVLGDDGFFEVAIAGRNTVRGA